MPNKYYRAGPATAEQIAVYGHVAATLRAALKEKGMVPGDLNEAIGKERGYSAAHVWLAGKGAPGPDNAKKRAKLFGVTAADLMRRKTPAAPLREVVRVAGAPPVPRPAGDVLSFSVDRAGIARIRVDATLTLEKAKPLLRMLLDAGVVFGEGEVIEHA
jgi:hypothetical protein